ncbi:DUF1993 domain-containing protein [Roseateles koreensis]|uniref:DUF1993 domain-containing protein n=1 Tax=Roseateles koreensis TaxID=2987526 RepID=A0ABT5KUU3_9BURK|nr:DUF1993 domain-containing protein [Roseateles koreensis]MDC8786708.1 DUF1993 domain-containing protein [Roseateles koreensis]
MNQPMYQASVPVFKQLLGSMSAVLGKADAHALARGIEPTVFLHGRLSPDMFPLLKQVQVACDFAKGVCARLAGVDVPPAADTETSFDELQARISSTLIFIEGLDVALFSAAAEREIVVRPGTPKERRFQGQDYLLHYGLPQFFFHATTTYAILRHMGVEIGKKDFMGSY